MPAALETVLVEALPTLLGGDPPPVELAVSAEDLVVDGAPPGRALTEPRAEDRRAELPFDDGDPAGPHTLPWPPLPGPRHVWLVAADGARERLSEDEVRWDDDDPRTFTLALAEERDVTEVRSLAVLTRAAVVRLGLTATRTLNVTLASDDEERLAAAEALAVGVVALNRQALIDRSVTTHEDGDYGMKVRLDALAVLRADSPDGRTRRLVLRADLELTATRALREDEVRPIERIASPGAVARARPVDVRIDVDA